MTDHELQSILERCRPPGWVDRAKCAARGYDSDVEQLIWRMVDGQLNPRDEEKAWQFIAASADRLRQYYRISCAINATDCVPGEIPALMPRLF